MKWIRRTLLVLLAIPLLGLALLLIAGQRTDAGRIVARLEIERPPAEVFRHIEDTELLQKWTGLAGIEALSEGPLGVGARARMTVEARGRRTDLESEVTAVERGRLLAFVLRTTGEAPLKFTEQVRYQLEERDGGTRLTVTGDTHYEGLVARLLEPLITPSAQRELERQLARLKAQVESAPAGPAPSD